MLDQWRRWRADVGAGLFLIVLNLLLYGRAIRLWWTYDDANHLRLTIQHPFLAAFTDREMWPQQLFTPFLMAGFEVHKHLFWLDASHWYMAYLGITCVAMLFVYASVRLFFGPFPSLAAAATVSLGVPLCSIVTQLSTMHYLVALIFMAAATIAFVVALRRASVLLVALSALLYLAAMLSKEFAVTLPIVLLALPLRDLKTRAKYVTAHAVAGIVYLIWRYLVIGTFLGAYGWKIDAAEWPRLIALLPWRVAVAAAGQNAVVGAGLLVLTTICIVVAARRRSTLLLLAAAVLMAFAPLLPVAKEVNRRYAFIPWIGWSIAFVAATTSLKNRRAANALLIAAPLLVGFANRSDWNAEYAARMRMSDEGRFYFSESPAVLIRRPTVPPAAMRELAWLKTVFLKQPAGASWFYDDFYTCGNALAGRQIWEYDQARRAMTNITSRMAEIRSSHCRSIRWHEPLTVQLEYRKPALYWRLGPHTAGEYTALLAEGMDAFKIPKDDALNLPGVDALEMRIRYQSPEGWSTYSDLIRMDFKVSQRYAWERP